MKNSSTFKIQIIFIGHLRGTDNLDSISNFFDNIDLNIINQRLNTSYSKIEYVYTLYTYPEINFKSNILNFGKKKYPELYKEYSIDDFYIWLKEFKSKFNFNNVILGDPIELKSETDILYNEYLSKIKDDDIKHYIETLKHHSGYQFTKIEKLKNFIEDDADVVFKIRPDLIFMDSNNPIHITNCIINTINKNEERRKKTIYTNYIVIDEGYVYIGDYYFIGTPDSIKSLIKNLQYNNLELRKEFDNLDKSKFPLIKGVLKNQVLNFKLERNILINLSIESLSIECIWSPHNLLFIYVPYELNKIGEIDWYTIHKQFDGV
jgi:hypothetical protein